MKRIQAETNRQKVILQNMIEVNRLTSHDKWTPYSSFKLPCPAFLPIIMPPPPNHLSPLTSPQAWVIFKMPPSKSYHHSAPPSPSSPSPPGWEHIPPPTWLLSIILKCFSWILISNILFLLFSGCVFLLSRNVVHFPWIGKTPRDLRLIGNFAKHSKHCRWKCYK